MEEDYQSLDSPFCLFFKEEFLMKKLYVLKSDMQNMFDYASLGVFDSEEACLTAANKLLKQDIATAVQNQNSNTFSGLVMDIHELNQANDDYYGKSIGWDVVNNQAVLFEPGIRVVGENFQCHNTFLISKLGNKSIVDKFDINKVLATANALEKPFAVNDFKKEKCLSYPETMIAKNYADNCWYELLVRVVYRLSKLGQVQAVDIIPSKSL